MIVRVRAPYVPAIIRVGRAQVGASEGCGCVGGSQSAEVFEALDMPHAAGMHLSGEGTVQWSSSDWTAHLDEEEAPGKFFDALRAIGARFPEHSRNHLEDQIAQLEAEHAVVRQGLLHGEVPAEDVATAHGAREDALVRRYYTQLMAYARWRKRRVGVGDEPIFLVSKEYIASLPKPPAPKTYLSPVLLGKSIDCGTPAPGRVPFHTPPTLTFVPKDRPPDGIVGALPYWFEGTPTYEKFADPWFYCLSNAGRGYVVDTPEASTLGVVNNFAYLADVPLNGADRVAAMRVKVDAYGDVTGNSALMNMRENSQEAVRKIGLNLLTLYKDPARHGELITTYTSIFKRPISEIENDRAKVEEIIRMTPPELSANLAELMREAKPMIDEVKRGVSDFANRIAGGTTSEAAGLFSSISSAVPIVNAVVALGKSLYDMINSQLSADAEAATAGCNGVLTDGNDYLKATIERGLPIPWHVVEFNPNCAGLTSDDEFKPAPFSVFSFYASVYNNLVRLYCLPLDAQQDIIQWWAHASAMMSHGEIARIFAALGNDGTYGGMIASDEQVLLVAAPIAVANGLDPYAFAAALWDRSSGWSSMQALMRREGDPVIAYRSFDQAKAMWDVLDGPCFKTTPDNALQVQWAVLTRDAFALVEAVKRGDVSLAAPPPLGIFMMASRSSTPWWILALGAAASGGLYLAGASIGIVAAPVAAAGLYVATR